ncbi:MAG: PEP-CTERM sorting domain-containing protein [Syntrophobacteraceae bacterium]
MCGNQVTTTYYYQPQITSAPEPSSLCLLGFSLLGFALCRRRRAVKEQD